MRTTAEIAAWREAHPGERLNLSGADLSYANLCIADFSYADLTDANLTGAELSRAINAERDCPKNSWNHKNNGHNSMIFIETTIDGRRAWMQIDHISLVIEQGENKCSVTMANGRLYTISEPAEQFIRKIAMAMSK